MVSSATEPDGNGSADDLEPPRSPGRPRDPDLEARVQRAALDLFGEAGWSGLTMDGIASRAHVGKSALYLRWTDKGEILVAALRAVQRDDLGAPDDDQAPDTRATPATVRDYLLRHALSRANLYLGEYGLAMLRLHTDVWASPEVLGTVRERAITRFVLDERDRVAAAIKRGEFAPGASAVRVLDAVEGAVLMHILVTPPELLPRVRTGIREYVELMVDDQLRAAGYRGPVRAAVDDDQRPRTGTGAP